MPSHQVTAFAEHASCGALQDLNTHAKTTRGVLTLKCAPLFLFCLLLLDMVPSLEPLLSRLSYPAWPHTLDPLVCFTNAGIVAVLQGRPLCSSTPQIPQRKGPTLLRAGMRIGLGFQCPHSWPPVNTPSPVTLVVSMTGKALSQPSSVMFLSHLEALGPQHLHLFFQSTHTGQLPELRTLR